MSDEVETKTVDSVRVMTEFLVRHLINQSDI